MTVKVLTQKSFFKGLNASVADSSQPKDTLARISNLLYTLRGSLRVMDGNLGFFTFNGAGPTTGLGNFMDIALFQPSNLTKYYLALAKGLTSRIGPITGLAAANGGVGSTLPAGTYFYVVTALDGVGGETTASNEVSIAIGGNTKVNLSWTAKPTATGYNVYRSTSSGTEQLLSGAGLPATANSFVDAGAAIAGAVAITSSIVVRETPSLTFVNWTVPTGLTVGTTYVITGVTPSSFNGTYTITGGAGTTFGSPNVNNLAVGTSGTGGTATPAAPTPPVSDTTQQSVLYRMPTTSPSYGPANIVAFLPADPFNPALPIEDGTGGGSGGSGGNTGGAAVGGGAASGGVVGNISTSPYMLQFTTEEILALGNGYPPQQWNNTTQTLTPLGNTFTSSFPAWIASTSLNKGSIIVPTAANGHLYTAIQSGTTGTVQPAFPAAPGATVADGTIIWQESGSTATPAPRGAAHAIVYAGSLWLWNTSPTTTNDNLDGPSCLKMSDVNNPNSWNPVNTAFVGRDDGQQGMGLATFTIAETGIPPEGSLVLFKEFSTYQVIGVFGSTNFAIQRAQTELGCIAPRTIKFVPGFGIMRLTHLGVAVFDGVRDRLISEEIRPYLFGGASDISQMDMSFAYFAKADLVANPPMYVMAIPVKGQGQDGRLTRLLCFDLVLKAWTIVDLPPLGISVFRQIYSPGSIPITVWGGMSNGMVSRWQSDDDQGFDAWLDPAGVTHLGSNITFGWRTNSAIQQSPTDRLYIRRAIVKGVIGANAFPPANVTADVVVNKIDSKINAPPLAIILQSIIFQTSTSSPLLSDTGFEYVVDVNQVGLDAYINFAGQSVPVAPGTFPHLFFDAVDWHVMPRPSGALVRVT
jgi:hypothetical protein